MQTTPPGAQSPAGAAAPATHFASPERASQEAVRQLSALTLNDPIVKAILDAVGGCVLVLNAQRQILAASHEVLGGSDFRGMDALLGKRPGEVLACEHAGEGPGGCGTSAKCRTCGAMLAILAAQASGRHVDGECSLTMRRDGIPESGEFKVRATPLVVGTTPVIVLVLHDNSALKRREVLERVFLHDARNTLGGLLGWSAKLSRDSSSNAAHAVLSLAEHLAEELGQHDVLLQAEQRTLVPQCKKVALDELFAQIRLIFERHACAVGKKLIAHPPSEPRAIVTDRTILRNVLANMLKNGFEAIAPGRSVELRFAQVDGRPRFSVSNEGVIPPDAAAQVFTRSFSTKPGHGRGIGTYSMRLLGEHYLQGKVWFTSTESEGTTFHLELPAGAVVPPAEAYGT